MAAAAGVIFIPAAAAGQTPSEYKRDMAALQALVSAELAEHEQDPRRALAEWQRLSLLVPDLPDVHGRMLDQAIALGDMASAATQAKLLWDAGDQSLEPRLILIAESIRRSDWKAADIYISQGLSGPAQREWERMFGPILRGWIAAQRKDKAGIVRAMEAKGGMSHPALKGHEALMMLAVGDKRQATGMAAALRPTDRTSQLIAVYLAQELEAAGLPNEAADLRVRIRLLDRAAEDPALLLPKRPMRSASAGVSHWFGMMAESFNRLNSEGSTPALALARSALHLDPSNWSARLFLAEEMVSQNRLEDAKALLEQGRDMPAIARLHRSDILLEMGQIGTALAEAKAAIAAPDTPNSLRIMQAELVRKSKDDPATVAAFTDLLNQLAKSDESPMLQALLLVSLADLRLKTEDWSAVAPLIERAVSLAPNDATVLNFAGYSAIERRIDLANSLDLIERAHRAQPENPSITDSLGWAFHLLGRHQEAVPLLEKAWRGEPSNAVIGEHLGDAYWLVGQRIDARALWNAAAVVAEADDEAMHKRLTSKMKFGLQADNAAP